MSQNGRRGGKKGRKIGRASRRPATARYKVLGMSVRNKIRKLKKHLKYYNHPNDKTAQFALARIQKIRKSA